MAHILALANTTRLLEVVKKEKVVLAASEHSAESLSCRSIPSPN
jgi:hypothetical protein